ISEWTISVLSSRVRKGYIIGITSRKLHLSIVSIPHRLGKEKCLILKQCSFQMTETPTFLSGWKLHPHRQPAVVEVRTNRAAHALGQLFGDRKPQSRGVPGRLHRVKPVEQPPCRHWVQPWRRVGKGQPSTFLQGNLQIPGAVLQ